MGENTKIEWAHHTFNAWIGCTKVSPACDHCYAEEQQDTRFGRVKWGPGNPRHRTSPANWRKPLEWNADARMSGLQTRVFALSLGDIWDNTVDSAWRRDLFELIYATPFLTWLLLSKRVGNAIKMCDEMRMVFPSNAALGATMINQEEWERDLPKLTFAAKALNARFTFASVEPMLGPIDTHGDMPDWVICGGESGTDARPLNPDWARSLRGQCQEAAIPFFFKQWGAWRPGIGVNNRHAHVWPDGSWSHKLPTKELAGRLLDGRTWDEVPA